MKVAIFGLGYVGTVTAAVLATSGHDVVGVDVDGTKVALVAKGQTPVVEPKLNGLVSSGALSGRLTATTDPVVALAGTEVSLVCVGTPSSPTGSTDVRAIERALGDIADALASGVDVPETRHAVVVRSTVPPGTVEELLAPLLRQRLAGSTILVGTGMCPEFLREGTAITDFYDAPLNVVGTDDAHVADAMRRLFAFLPVPLRVVGIREAEGLKYACNAFHATKVSFANEMSRLFRHLGVDSRLVMQLFCEDRKLNISTTYLSPGFAFGGSCLPKDLRSLLYVARMNCIDLPLLAGALATNELSVNDVINRVLATDARSVALLGLSFKADSDDLRESPYVALAETLIGKGYEVRIYDPVVDTERLVGSNRRYLVSQLPHVHRALRSTAVGALTDVDVALVSSAHPSVIEAISAVTPPMTIDLNGNLGPFVESLPGYEGVAW